MGANKLTMDCNKNRNNNANEVAEDATVSSQAQTQTTTFPQKVITLLVHLIWQCTYSQPLSSESVQSVDADFVRRKS